MMSAALHKRSKPLKQFPDTPHPFQIPRVADGLQGGSETLPRQSNHPVETADNLYTKTGTKKFHPKLALSKNMRYTGHITTSSRKR